MSARSIFAALTAIGCVFASPNVIAQQSSGVMEVGATVTQSCAVTTSPMTFQLDNSSESSTTAQASVALDCNGQTDYELAMDGGSNAVGDTRRMIDTASGRTLPYEIYSDSTRRNRWGKRVGIDTVSGTADVQGLALHVAYGAIMPTQPSLEAGTYSDAVVVTVNF